MTEYEIGLSADGFDPGAGPPSSPPQTHSGPDPLYWATTDGSIKFCDTWSSCLVPTSVPEFINSPH